MEDLPHPCFTGASAGEYAKKHDPFAYYTRIAETPATRCAEVVPLAQLAADEQRHALPRFIWITPNLCHDMHDCDVATGDRFLSGLLPPLLASLGPRGLLFLTWDEGSSDDGCCRLAVRRPHRHDRRRGAGPAGRPPEHPDRPLLGAADDRGPVPAAAAAGCRVRVHAPAAVTARYQRALTRARLRSAR